MAPRVPQSAPGRALTRRRYNGTRRVTRGSSHAVAAEWTGVEGPGCGQSPAADSLPEGVLRSDEVPRFSVVGFIFLSLLCFACLGGVASWARAVGARTLRHGRRGGTAVTSACKEGVPEPLPLPRRQHRRTGRGLASNSRGGRAEVSSEKKRDDARPAGMTSLERREASSLWIAPNGERSSGKLARRRPNERGPPRGELNASLLIPPLARLASQCSFVDASFAQGHLVIPQFDLAESSVPLVLGSGIRPPATSGWRLHGPTLRSRPGASAWPLATGELRELRASLSTPLPRRRRNSAMGATRFITGASAASEGGYAVS